MWAGRRRLLAGIAAVGLAVSAPLIARGAPDVADVPATKPPLIDVHQHIGLSLILRKRHPFANDFSAHLVIFHMRLLGLSYPWESTSESRLWRQVWQHHASFSLSRVRTSRCTIG